ncbi:MAG: hypothetical protein JWN38_998 [Candidatus Saccharibacteria bacterium]|nr:hypothetical protein [Candidatus Saccharibacteria bacterium]
MPHKIAIVEDDRSIADMYAFKLGHSGFLVQVARNGVEGLEMIKAFRPDLILLDLKMPIMPGDEMLEQLRSHEWGTEIKVIILTNISKDEAPHKLRFLNVERYIVKAHYTPSQVMAVIKEVLP